MKKTYKTFGIISFILSMFSPMIAFSLCCEIGEDHIFGIGGMLRYTWIFFLFIPVAAISFFVGKKLKSLGMKYKKNYVICYIVIPLMVLFGTYKWIFSDTTSYDRSNIENVESKISVSFPENLKISNLDYTEYTLSYAKILSDKEKADFENEIITNEKWTDNWGTLIENQMPFDVIYEVPSFEFCVCVFKNGEDVFVNEYPGNSGMYECVFVWYDADLGRIVVVNDYSIFINQGDTIEKAQ